MSTLERIIQDIRSKYVANDNEKQDPPEPEPLPPYDYREVEENEET